MNRSQALRAYKEARESGDKHRMHHAEADLRKATHAILSNHPRKVRADSEAFNRGVDDALTLRPLRPLWLRVWDRLVRTTP